jgi:uncharacterized membrane protein YkoI
VKLKQYSILAVGIIIGIGLSLAGFLFISKDENKNAQQTNKNLDLAQNNNYIDEEKLNTQNTTINNDNKSNSNNQNSELIGEEKAKSIMLDKVPGATIIKFELDYDDGVAEYEADLIKDGVKYEITVNAKTGIITEYEIDYK